MNRRCQVESWVEDVPDRREKGVHIPDQGRGSQGHHNEVGVFIEPDNSPRIQHAPENSCLGSQGEADQIINLHMMSRLWKKEIGADCCYTCECGLKVEDHAPGLESDDYSADERTKSWADESP